MNASELRSILMYDRLSGIFRWRSSLGGVTFGAIAGRVKSDGYIEIHVRGKSYGAHRLAWLYVYGEFPKNEIDHINGNRADNRIRNLRNATKAENQHNRSLVSRISASGLTGVFPNKNGKWSAGIRVDGKRTTIGSFATKEEASAAYLRAKRKLHPKCDRAKVEAEDIAYKKLCAIFGEAP